jgi:hypothetical protein
MRNKILFLLLLVLSVSGSNLFAQSAGISFNAGIPMGEFKENVDNTGWGISGHFLLLPITKANPFSIGLNIGYLNYGNENWTERLRYTNMTVDVERTNNLVNFHLFFQAGWPTGPIRPYIEGLFGGSYLFTSTALKSYNNEDVGSETEFDDFAWSYGGGGGFLIRLTSDPDQQISGLFLDFKVRYLAGSKAEYLREGSVELKNDDLYYDVIESKTDLLTIHAGVVIEFNSLFNE